MSAGGFNGRLTDAGAAISAILAPLRGVSDVPTLTLEDAINHDPILAAAGLEGDIFVAMAHAESMDLPEGVTVEQAASVVLFTIEGPLYRLQNERLRDADRTKLKPMYPLLKLQLGCLAALKRQTRTVFRGVRADIKDQYPMPLEGKAAKKIFWWSLTSTTSSINTLDDETFLGKKGTRCIFSIDAWDLVSIKEFSTMPHEDELVLLPGTCLTVKGVLDMGNGLTMIQLVQQKAPAMVDMLPQHPNPIFSPFGGGGGGGGNMDNTPDGPPCHAKLKPILPGSAEELEVTEIVKSFNKEAMDIASRRLCFLHGHVIDNEGLKHRYDVAKQKLMSVREGSGPNEKLLMHSTDAWEEIADSGFKLMGNWDEDRQAFMRPNGEAPQLFGNGVYFTNAPSKTNYTQRMTLLICSVALGKQRTLVHQQYNLDAKKMKNASYDSVFSDEGCGSDSDNDGDEYTGGRRPRHPEFVVYNPSQALPKYSLYFGVVSIRSIGYYKKLAEKRASESEKSSYELQEQHSERRKQFLSAMNEFQGDAAMLTDPNVAPSADFVTALSHIGDYFVNPSSREREGDCDAKFEIVLHIIGNAMSGSSSGRCKMKRSEILVWAVARILSSAIMHPGATLSRRSVRNHPELLSNLRHLVKTLLVDNEAVVQQMFVLLANAYFDEAMDNNTRDWVYDMWGKGASGDGLKEPIGYVFAAACLRNHIANDGTTGTVHNSCLQKCASFLEDHALSLSWWLANCTAALSRYNQSSPIVNAYNRIWSSWTSRNEIIERSNDVHDDGSDNPSEDVAAWRYFWWYMPVSSLSVDSIKTIAETVPELGERFYPLGGLLKRSNLYSDIGHSAMQSLVRAADTCADDRKQMASILQKLSTSDQRKFMTESQLASWADNKLGSGGIGATTASY